jgi:hypothetical protein
MLLPAEKVNQSSAPSQFGKDRLRGEFAQLNSTKSVAPKTDYEISGLTEFRAFPISED